MVYIWYYYSCSFFSNILVMKLLVRPIMFIALSIIMGLLVILYYVIDPANSHFVPKCIFKTLTGYDCPSCGGQRALHALLNGQIFEAIMYNPFIFFVTPYLLAVLYASISKSRVAMSIRAITHHYIVIILYLIVYILWWILRNTLWWQQFCFSLGITC